MPNLQFLWIKLYLYAFFHPNNEFYQNYRQNFRINHAQHKAFWYFFSLNTSYLSPFLLPYILLHLAHYRPIRIYIKPNRLACKIRTNRQRNLKFIHKQLLFLHCNNVNFRFWGYYSPNGLREAFFISHELFSERYFRLLVELYRRNPNGY